ncbi:MAG: hypothetical protein WD049_02165 [Candidatus Paceibacterota bacterium]
MNRLSSQDEQSRVNAEQGLIELKADASDALLRAACGRAEPRKNVIATTLRILSEWEQRSWTDPQSAAAIDEFAELARDPRYISGEDVPLGPNARDPFAEHLRVLDVTPDAAAAYLREKPGVKVNRDQNGFYTSISLGSRWLVEPKDWLYIANLPREIEGTPYINGRRHPISISVVGPVPGDNLLECLRNLRKLVNSPLELFFQQARINRECLMVLKSFGQMRALTADDGNEDIKDEDWAACLANWPIAHNLWLSPNAGKKTVAVASESKELTGLMFKKSQLTEADLEPLRGHEKLKTLWLAVDSEEEYTDVNGEQQKRKILVTYLNQKGTGKWQLEKAATGE